MSDFDVKIVAIDAVMDAMERYQRENADIRAHITFDMRSLFHRLHRERTHAQNEVEALQSRIDICLASMEEGASDEEWEPSRGRELEELYEKLWQTQRKLVGIEELTAHAAALGNDLLQQFLEASHYGSGLAEDALRFMGRYIHDLNLVCNREALGGGAYRAAEGYYVCVLDSTLYPATAEHIRVAQKKGYPARLTVDRSRAAQRRETSLQGMPVRPDFDRDEYPMALFLEGGSGADVVHLEGADNRGAGSYISWQLRGVPDGAEVRIRVI